MKTETQDPYRAALKLFVSTDVEYRISLCTPFFQDEYVLASDAVKIICFPKTLLNKIDFEGHEKAPNALQVIPYTDNTDIELSTYKLRKAIEQSSEKTAETYDIKKIKCPDCNGIGLVEYQFRDHNDTTHEIEQDCPTCAEQDDFFLIKDRKTGYEIESFRQLIKIDGTLFDIVHFEALVRTAELLSVKTVTLSFKTTSLSPHKFIVGECIICLMPMREASIFDLVIEIDND